ncbi:hypothetical protein Q4I32_000160 [Leishmania shawi]|uniref:Uncharacterized protein n=1 Tax=Leishmania shawi TaxID=5680 RepID=A0AAW3CDS0_9TRYP
MAPLNAPDSGVASDRSIRCRAGGRSMAQGLVEPGPAAGQPPAAPPACTHAAALLLPAWQRPPLPPSSRNVDAACVEQGVLRAAWSKQNGGGECSLVRAACLAL